VHVALSHVSAVVPARCARNVFGSVRLTFGCTDVADFGGADLLSVGLDCRVFDVVRRRGFSALDWTAWDARRDKGNERKDKIGGQRARKDT